jgi:hypothetical protein
VINVINHFSNVLQTKINARANGGKKENANWVVSLNPKTSTYNFAKAEVDF